jgi:hypothetical protein
VLGDSQCFSLGIFTFWGKKKIEKGLFCHKISILKEKFPKKEKFLKNCHYCLQHERVFKIFSTFIFEYLNITKFG